MAEKKTTAMYGNMTLRERITEDNNQRRTLRADERLQESTGARPKNTAPKKKVTGRGAKYTPQGRHKETDYDLCDCLDVHCLGCFFPCKDCSSQKCGHLCRRSRRWIYEEYQIEGTPLAPVKMPHPSSRK